MTSVPMTRWMLLSLLLPFALWPRESAATAAKPGDAAIKRDLNDCRAHGDIDACYDAIRWQPADPALQIALGNALLAAKRPADALRAYRRAAELAPETPGIAAKINSATVKASSQRAPSTRAAATDAAVPATAAKHYSNAEPEAHSH